MKRFLCLAAVAAFLCALIPAASAAGASGAAIAVRDGVVRVLSSDGDSSYSGSAFVLSSDSGGTYVATNYHVVEGSDPSTVQVLDHKGDATPADIEFYSEAYDLCVLKTEKPLSGVTTVSLYPQGDAAVGNEVYALGFPGAGDILLDELGYKVEDITVTNGIISAVKTVTVQGGKLTLVQMNAEINPGSSGGPLVDADGRVVGVNTLRVEDSSGVFAAVSIRHLLALLTKNSIPYRTDVAAASSDNLLLILLLCGGAVLLLAGGTVLVILLQKKHRTTLACRMEMRLHGYTPGEALNLLDPALRQLMKLHRVGRGHGGVYPANLFVDRAGRIHLGNGSVKPEPTPDVKPYLATELYNEYTGASPVSDVYAMTAVLYYMISCREPDEVIQRMENDTLPASLKKLYDSIGPVSGTLGRGMSLDPAIRIPDAYALAGELGAAVAATGAAAPIPSPLAAGAAPTPLPVQGVAETAAVPFPVAEDPAAIQPEAPAAPVQPPVSAGEIPAELPQEVSAAPVAEPAPAAQSLPAQAMGRSAISQPVPPAPEYVPAPWNTAPGSNAPSQGAPHMGQAYQPYPAPAPVPKKKRKIGLIVAISAAAVVILALGGTFGYCEIRYNDAVRLMGEGDCTGAQSAVNSIFPFYRDAETLKKYIEAGVLLEDGDYSGAKDAFTALEDYRDAKKMITECDYQEAVFLYNKFIGASYTDRIIYDAQDVLERLQALGSYNDSADMLLKMQNAIVGTGVSYLQEAAEDYFYNDSYQSDFFGCVDDAMAFFGLTDAADAPRYRKMCDALYTKNPETIYNWLTANKDLKVADAMRYSEVLVPYIILGSWSGNGYYLTLNRQGVSTNLVTLTGSYRIEKDGDTYNWMVSTDGGNSYDLGFTIEFADDNTFTADVGGASYTLYRQ